MTQTSQYLLAIYIAQHRHDPPVQPSVVGDILNRSPAAVTEMCQRLAADDLVTYEAYEGATLTEVGHKQAAQLHETYVTVSWFFRSVLELDDYESEAMELAGLISPMVARRLAATLPCETPSHARTESDLTASETAER